MLNSGVLKPSMGHSQTEKKNNHERSALVGAIALSRAVSDEALSREILHSVSELLKKKSD
jgi:hypothetical protein